MLLSEMIDVLGCEEIGVDNGHRLLEISTCFAADLMSEVLAFCGHGAVLITGLASVQSVHTADVADLSAILFVNGKQPGTQVRDLARDRGIPLLSTRRTMFEVCATLHEHGLRPSLKD